MDTCPGTQIVDQHSADVIEPILIYRGRIYKLESGSVYPEATDDGFRIHAQGLWEDVTDAPIDQPWIPSLAELELAEDWDIDLLGPEFIHEFEEIMREDWLRHEKEMGLVHRPQPRYGV